MGESFLIVNHAKRQYLSPARLPASDRFPAILLNGILSPCVSLLVVRRQDDEGRRGNPAPGPYSKELAGSWFGDKVSAVGDIHEETAYREICTGFADITPRAIAMLFEHEELVCETMAELALRDRIAMGFVGSVAMLGGCPKLEYELTQRFGDWKAAYYTAQATGATTWPPARK